MSYWVWWSCCRDAATQQAAPVEQVKTTSAIVDVYIACPEAVVALVGWWCTLTLMGLLHDTWGCCITYGAAASLTGLLHHSRGCCIMYGAAAPLMGLLHRLWGC